jgi:hypothetical protein
MGLVADSEQGSSVGVVDDHDGLTWPSFDTSKPSRRASVAFW